MNNFGPDWCWHMGSFGKAFTVCLIWLRKASLQLIFKISKTNYEFVVKYTCMHRPHNPEDRFCQNKALFKDTKSFKRKKNKETKKKSKKKQQNIKIFKYLVELSVIACNLSYVNF